MRKSARIKVAAQHVEAAASVLFTTLYGEVYAGIDWHDLLCALAGGKEPTQGWIGLSEEELLRGKDAYETADGLFLFILLPRDVQLDKVSEITDRVGGLFRDDANIAWTFSYSETVTEPTYFLFVKHD